MNKRLFNMVNSTMFCVLILWDIQSGQDVNGQ